MMVLHQISSKDCAKHWKSDKMSQNMTLCQLEYPIPAKMA